MISLASASWTASINPVGGGLAALACDGDDLVVAQDGEGGHPTYRGAVLAPWPNRLEDGAYTFDGVERTLAINEPERRTAHHGLVTDIAWEVVAAAEETVRLRVQVPRSDGYPFAVRLDLAYALSADGLAVTLVATNIGDDPAPYGCGFHPYLRLPDADGADADGDEAGGAATEVLVPADVLLEVTSQRLLPTGTAPVDGSPYDFRTARPLGATALDTAYTALRRDDSGVAAVRVGRTLLRLDGALPWVQLYTPPDRRSIAVEPCSCPANAFRTGHDLVILTPGQRHVAAWEIARTVV